MTTEATQSEGMRKIRQAVREYDELGEFTRPDISRGVVDFLRTATAARIVELTRSDPMFSLGSSSVIRVTGAAGRSIYVLDWGNVDGNGMLACDSRGNITEKC